MPKMVKTTALSKKYGAGHELLQYDAKSGTDLPKEAQAAYNDYAKGTEMRKKALVIIERVMKEHAKTKLGIPGPVDVMVGYEKVTLDAVESETSRTAPAVGNKTEEALAGDIARVFGAKA